MFSNKKRPSTEKVARARRPGGPAARPDPRPELAHGVSLLRHRLLLQEGEGISLRRRPSFDASSARACAAARVASSSDEASSSGAAASPLPPMIRGDDGFVASSASTSIAAAREAWPQAMRDAGSDAKSTAAVRRSVWHYQNAGKTRTEACAPRCARKSCPQNPSHSGSDLHLHTNSCQAR